MILLTSTDRHQGRGAPVHLVPLRRPLEQILLSSAPAALSFHLLNLPALGWLGPLLWFLPLLLYPKVRASSCSSYVDFNLFPFPEEESNACSCGNRNTYPWLGPYWRARNCWILDLEREIRHSQLPSRSSKELGRMPVEMLIVKRCHGVYGASAEHAEEGGKRGI